MNGENDRTSGGTIFFITDGEQSCSNDNEITIHDDGENEVINRAKRSKVRIITVAFGYKSLFFCSKDGNVILDFLNNFLQKRC